MNCDAASDYPRAGNQTRRDTEPPVIDMSAELVTRRFSPLTSLIVVTLLSLAIWVAIWTMFRSILWG